MNVMQSGFVGAVVGVAIMLMLFTKRKETVNVMQSGFVGSVVGATLYCCLSRKEEEQ